MKNRVVSCKLDFQFSLNIQVFASKLFKPVSYFETRRISGLHINKDTNSWIASQVQPEMIERDLTLNAKNLLFAGHSLRYYMNNPLEWAWLFLFFLFWYSLCIAYCCICRAHGDMEERNWFASWKSITFLRKNVLSWRIRKRVVGFEMDKRERKKKGWKTERNKEKISTWKRIQKKSLFLHLRDFAEN